MKINFVKDFNNTIYNSLKMFFTFDGDSLFKVSNNKNSVIYGLVFMFLYFLITLYPLAYLNLGEFIGMLIAYFILGIILNLSIVFFSHIIAKYLFGGEADFIQLFRVVILSYMLFIPALIPMFGLIWVILFPLWYFVFFGFVLIKLYKLTYFLVIGFYSIVLILIFLMMLL